MPKLSIVIPWYDAIHAIVSLLKAGLRKTVKEYLNNQRGAGTSRRENTVVSGPEEIARRFGPIHTTPWLRRARPLLKTEYGGIGFG